MDPNKQVVSEKQELPISPQEVKEIQALTGGNVALTIVLILAVLVYRVKGLLDTNTKSSDRALELLEQRLGKVENHVSKCKCEDGPSIEVLDKKIGDLMRVLESKND
jgi:hypothetical protein